MAARTLSGAGMPMLSRYAHRMPDTPMTEPTERSNIPMVTSSIMPMAIMARGAMTVCRDRRLFRMKKYGLPTIRITKKTRLSRIAKNES